MIHKNNILKYLTAVVMILWLAVFEVQTVQASSESAGHSDHEAHAARAGHDDDLVLLSESEINEFGIEITPAGPGNIELHLDLMGEIALDPARFAHITPRFAGIVQEVRKTVGDPVQKGDVLAIIESNESLVPFAVKSLISGTVISMHLTQGEVIGDNDHAFEVADLSVVWANLSIYQKDLTKVKNGQKAIITAGPGRMEATGVISYVSPVVDETTRTATARVILDNTGGQWRPGMFVTARVIIANEPADIVVPKTAIQTFEGRTVVFVRDSDGFRPRAVELGRTNSVSAEIRHGLDPGTPYVSKGGFILKAELQKAAFGGGHGH